MKADIGVKKSEDASNNKYSFLLKYAFRRIIIDSFDTIKPSAILNCKRIGAFNRWATISWDAIKGNNALARNKIVEVVNFLRYAPFDQDVVSIFRSNLLFANY